MPVYGASGSQGEVSATLGTKSLPGLPVASNCWGAQGSSNGIPTAAATAAVTTRSRHRATSDCADLVLCYTNMITLPPPEVDGPNVYTIRAAIEWGGIVLPVSFGGLRSGACDPGGLLVSDPLAVEFARGNDFWVRTYVSASGTGIVTGNRVTYSGGEGLAVGDLTATGAGAIADSSGFAYGPAAILGTAPDPTASTFGLVGDSIASGTGDSSSYSEMAASGVVAGGFIARAMARSFAYVSVTQGSESAQQWLMRHRRAALLNTCKHWIVQYGHNDMAAGRTATQIRADLMTIARQGKTRGAKIWLTTQTPASTSTDGWATLVNQTTSVVNQEKQALNAWLRDGCPIDSGTLAPVNTGTSSGVLRAGVAGHPVSGVLDTGAAVESSAASGMWVVGTTSDGTHPNAAGHALMAAALSPILPT